MIPVSVIIVTKNAATQIEACLSALKDFDELIVVDSYSSDNTTALARPHKATVVNFKWNGAYPKKRQWCLDTLSLKHDWVFFVDADEVVTEGLIQEIKNIFPTNAAGYFVNGQYVWNGKTLNYGLKNKKIALFNRRKMQFPEINDIDCDGMGEIEGHYQPVLKEDSGEIETLKSPLLHYANHSKADWLERHQRYAAWERCMNTKNAWPTDPVPWRNTLKKILRQNFFKPELAFIHTYFLKFGFLDGVTGFDFAKSRWTYYRMILRK